MTSFEILVWPSYSLSTKEFPNSTEKIEASLLESVLICLQIIQIQQGKVGDFTFCYVFPHHKRGTGLTPVKICFSRKLSCDRDWKKQNKKKKHTGCLWDFLLWLELLSPLMCNSYSHRDLFFSDSIHFYYIITHQKYQAHSQSPITFGLCSPTFASRSLQFRNYTLLVTQT